MLVLKETCRQWHGKTILGVRLGRYFARFWFAKFDQYWTSIPNVVDLTSDAVKHIFHPANSFPGLIFIISSECMTPQYIKFKNEIENNDN